MNTMTKEDNSIYASRSGLVLMAATPSVHAADATVAAARAADKVGPVVQRTFAQAVTDKIVDRGDGMDPSAIY